MAIIQGAEPFFLPGGDKGVLLIHGFTGSPSEMRLAGEYLHNLGYTVLAPRLCGHGTTPEEMAKTSWPHWYSAVEDGYHLLAGVCREVAVAGLSLGGLLALKLCSEYPVNKVATLSTPIYIANKRLGLLPAYRMFTDFVPKQQRRLPEAVRAYSVCYDVTPLSSLSSLLELIKQVDVFFPEITIPALVMQSKREHTVKPESAQYIYDRLGSQDKRLVWLDKSGHIVTLDMERDYVFAQLAEFFG